MKLACYDISEEFGQVSTVTLDGFTVHLVAANHQVAEGSDPVKSHFTGHWQVTDYATAYNDYQIVICWDAARGRVVILRCLPHTAKGCHTWKRNTANEGYAFAAMYGAIPTANLLRIAKPGPYPILSDMIQGAALYIAEYAAWHRLDLAGNMRLPTWRANFDETDMTQLDASGLVTPVHADHAFFARADRYADARWDNAEITAQVQAAALGYFAELKGKREADGSARHFLLLDVVRAA